jgi:hypothetical protein
MSSNMAGWKIPDLNGCFAACDLPSSSNVAMARRHAVADVLMAPL